MKKKKKQLLKIRLFKSPFKMRYLLAFQRYSSLLCKIGTNEVTKVGLCGSKHKIKDISGTIGAIK